MMEFLRKKRKKLKKKKLFLILSFFYLTFWPGLILADQETGLELILLNEIEEKNPGETVFIRFFLQNLTSQPWRVILKYFWPEDWTFLGNEEEVTIGSLEKKLMVAPFYIPRKTEAGEKAIKIEAISKENQIIKLESEVKIKIKSKIEFELKAKSLSLLAKAGEEIIFPFYIINKSNMPLRISLKPEINFSWPIIMEAETLFLETGEEREINIRVKTKRNITHKYTLHLILTAQAEGADLLTKLTAYSTATIFPDSISMEIKKGFPVYLSFLSLSQKKASFAQANFQLSLARNQNQRLDLYLRGPAQKEFMLFGYFPDEYRFHYSRPTWSVFFGDKLYSCSRLTNFGEYGRGMDLSWRFKWAEIKTLFYQPLFQEKARGNPFSLKLNFLPQKKVNFSFIFFESKDQEKRNVTYSLESQLKSQSLQAEVELALSNPHQSYQSPAFGLWFDLLSHFKNWKVKTIYLTTTPNFAGFYKNLNFTSFNLAYTAFDCLELKSGYSWERLNPQRDADSRPSQQKASFFGFNFHPNNYLSIVLTAHCRQKKMESEIKEYWEEKYLQIDFIKLFNNFNFSGYFNYGKTDYFPENRKQTLYGLGFSLSGNIAQTSFLALNLRWRNQKYNYFDDTSDNKEISFNFKKTIKKFELVLLYKNLWQQNQKIYLFSQDYLERILYRNISSYFESSLNLALNPKHNLSFKLRYAKGKETFLNRNSNWLALVEYKIAIPFSTREEGEGGQIKGKIISPELPKKAIKGIKVKLNSFSKISDPQGNFSFSGLSAGDYFLSLDTDSLPSGWVPVTPLPMKIKLEAKEKKIVEILLAQAAQLQGKILNFQKKDFPEIKMPQEKKEPLSLLGPAEFVEIKQANLRLIAPVKEDGSFSCEQLRPGKWEIKYEDNTMEINLLPGEKKEISLESKPKKKTILIVDKGEINLSPQLWLSESSFAPASNDYLIQLGAFSVKENAYQFLEIIRPLFPEAKLACLEANSKSYYKIFLVSSDLATAKKLMESITIQGYEAYLIPPPEQRKIKTSLGTSDFAIIQVGSFSDRTKALALKKKLEKEYEEIFIETICHGQTLFYRVQIKTPKEEAKKVMAKLEQNKIKYWKIN